MHINRAVADDHVVAPDGIQDFIAEKDPARFEGQQVKQFKFFFRQDNLLFLHFHNKPLRVYGHIADIQDSDFGLIEPAEQGINSADKYFGTDRLTHIIVRPGLQSADLGAFVIHSRQKNDQSFFESGLGA